MLTADAPRSEIERWATAPLPALMAEAARRRGAGFTLPTAPRRASREAVTFPEQSHMVQLVARDHVRQ